MSVATLPELAARSADELVASLPPEMKSDVFCALFRELIRHNANAGRIPVITADREFLGSVVPAAAERERYDTFVAGLSTDTRERMTRPLPPDFDPDDVLSDEELAALRTGVRPQSR